MWAGACGLEVNLAGKLTVLKAKSLTQPGRYGDGDGLWLQVRSADKRSWLFRFTRHGQAREMGLGPFPGVSLAEARQGAEDCRRQLRQGIDPIDQRQALIAAAAAAAPTLTFRQVADRYHEAHNAAWRNQKHREQWKTTMEAYVYPAFGGRPVASIATGDVMRALEPIWREKSMTATVLRGRIEAVLDYAKARDWRTGENPARWRGHLKNLLPARNRIVKVEHHAAVPWREVAGFMAQLGAQKDLAARALEFLILTAVRTNEGVGAQWGEVDLPTGTWTIPADRMKGGKEHRVPLSSAAVAVIARLPSHGGAYLFPSPRGQQPLSTRACAVLLGRMGRSDITVHGFRSTFRDWCSETTSFPHEVAEAALAHTIRNRVEAAYRRGDLFDKRREMMEAWGQHCWSKEAESGRITPNRDPRAPELRNQNSMLGAPPKKSKKAKTPI